LLKSAAGLTRENDQSPVSGITFWLLIFFMVNFFLHFSARVPAYGVIRPTLLLVGLLTFLLWAQKDKFSFRESSPLVAVSYTHLTLPTICSV